MIMNNANRKQRIRIEKAYNGARMAGAGDAMRTDFAGSGLADVHDENGIVLGPPPKDKLGQEVRPGAIIAYGHALGRCAGLRIGRVLDLGKTAPPSWSTAAPGWKATVIGIDDDWARVAPKLNMKTGTLFFPERWIVLSREQVPEAYRALLEGYVRPEPKRKRGKP